ncbi:MAG TPA: Mbeg1-like protein, partial [Candidatus Nanopelagicales bacterium]|nr:Mbeg1-like protein [Candidatus Nanopelagicales bacterium]
LEGKELVFEHAQKDRTRLVKNDEQITVVHDRQKLVKNDETEETEHYRRRWVGKSLDVVVKRHKRERIENDSHLVVKGNRRERIDGKQSLTVAENQHEKVEGRHALRAEQQLHLLAGENLVGEGSEDVTVKGPGGFFRIDASGITIKGTVVNINTGGTPGRGRGSRPESPAAAQDPQKAEVQGQGQKAVGPSRAMVQEGARPGLTGKAARLAERRALIAAARARAQGLDANSPERKRLLDAAARLDRNNHAVEMARLSRSVYDDTGAPEGWRRIPPEEMPPRLRDQVWEDKDSGFFASMYESEEGQKVLVFRGTNEAKDWKTNIPQGIGLETDQYNYANRLGVAMSDTYGSEGFEVSGHSLGGGLATMAVVSSGARGTTFNAAGLHPRSARRAGADFSRGADLIDTYAVDGEVLTSVQTVPFARQAVGKWHSLPAVGDGMLGTAAGGASKGAAVGGLLGPKGAAIGGALGAVGAVGKLSVARHGMDFVVNGIEAQKTEDIQIMQAATGAAPNG